MSKISGKRRPTISAAALDKLFFDMLAKVDLPEGVSRDEVEFALQLKLERNDRLHERKRREVENKERLKREREEREANLEKERLLKVENSRATKETPDETKSTDPQSALSMVKGGLESAREAMASVRSFLSGSKSITIIDPYLFHFNPSRYFPHEEDYIDTICELVPRATGRVTLVAPTFKSTVKGAILNRLKEGRDLKWIQTDQFHDRFVLRDDNRGLIIGTSFGGFGNKIFYIKEADEDEVKDTKACLYEVIQSQT